MPTVCELKVELKRKGIKGISGLNKAGLEKLLKEGKPTKKDDLKEKADKLFAEMDKDKKKNKKKKKPESFERKKPKSLLKKK